MRTVFAALVLALSVCAQQPSRQVVIVTPGAASRPAGPTKIVRVLPAPTPAPVGAYAGSRGQRDWRGTTRGAFVQRRAQYATWRARFRPTHPFRSVPLRFRAGWR